MSGELGVDEMMGVLLEKADAGVKIETRADVRLVQVSFAVDGVPCGALAGDLPTALRFALERWRLQTAETVS